jgi:hypothetical protein
MNVKPQVPEDRKIWAQCQHCLVVTSHSVLTTALVSDPGSEAYTIRFDEYMCIQCEGCKSVSFCQEGWIGENVFDEGPWDEAQKTRRLYPPRWAKSVLIADIDLLPSDVRRVYEETYAALASGFGVLCGIGIRAIVEAVCNEKNIELGPPGGYTPPLKTRISAMVAAGMTTPDGAAVLDKLRDMGNDAAHEAKPHEDSQLSAALDVVNHLLLTVYIIPQRAQELP